MLCPPALVCGMGRDGTIAAAVAAAGAAASAAGAVLLAVWA